MSNLIETNFRKISDQKYIAVNRQIGFAVMGGIGLLIFIMFFPLEIWRFFSEGSTVDGLIGAAGTFVLCSIMFLIIAMGLFKTTTEIDLSTRKVRITKRNIRGASATSEAPLDDLRISAVRMGVSDSAPHGAWIVRAGFMFEGENGQDSSVAIWSKEVSGEQNISERNKIMFELYQFFFPERPAVGENNIITNGTAVMLLSDSEKDEFSKEEELFEKKPEVDGNAGDSKWDRLC